MTQVNQLLQSCNIEEHNDDNADETALSVSSAQTIVEQQRLSEEPLLLEATSEAVEVLELTSILPEKIEERVLARPYDLGEQLKVTLRNDLNRGRPRKPALKN